MRRLARLVKDPVDDTLVQVPRALVLSILVAGIDCSILAALVLAQWHPAAAAVVSYLLGGVVQYVGCSLWVFPSAPRNAVVGFAQFTLLSLVGLAPTWLAIEMLHEALGVPLAKAVALALSFSWNFTSRKLLVFRSAPVVAVAGSLDNR